MPILVSFCNVRTPGVPRLGLFDPATSSFHVLRLPGELVRCSGMTGLALSEQHLFVVSQAALRLGGRDIRGLPVLLTFDRADLSLRNHHVFHNASDVHSLWLESDALYAVSTGTDEVLGLQLDGGEVVSERVFWRPDPHGPRQDIHHLNVVFGWNGDLLVSGFAKKTGAKWSSANDGFIINLRAGQKVLTGIHQPHSFAVIDGVLAYCESRQMAVRAVGDGRCCRLPGYTRGLCLAEGKLFAGTSMARKRSKSTGVVNQAADNAGLESRCVIARIEPATFQIEQVVDLDAYAQEIYDLLPVDGVEAWPTVSEIDWRDTALEEMADVLEKREDRIATLERELNVLYCSLSWKVTRPLRKTQVLARRFGLSA